MITADHVRLMAEYNQWMNQRLYDLCEPMGDEARKLDRGAFFGSIHSTLNHILYGDLAFMSRFTGDLAEAPPIGVDLHDDFADLKAARPALDARIVAWGSSLEAEWLAADITYTSKVDGVTRTLPNWMIVTHMLNHQTHHRGQITTLLSQMGLDIGTTDIPFMPRFGE